MWKATTVSTDGSNIVTRNIGKLLKDHKYNVRKLEFFIFNTPRIPFVVKDLRSDYNFTPLKSDKTQFKINECCEEVKI